MRVQLPAPALNVRRENVASYGKHSALTHPASLSEVAKIRKVTSSKKLINLINSHSIFFHKFFTRLKLFKYIF